MHRIRGDVGINPDTLAGLVDFPVTTSDVFIGSQLRLEEQPIQIIFNRFHKK